MSTLSSGVAQFKKEFASIETSESKVRSFAFVVGGVLVALGLFAAYREHIVRSELLVGAGTALVVFGIIRPIILTPLYRLWMGLAIILGVFVGNALLTLFYFFILTPIGLLKHFFQSSTKDREESYWLTASPFKKESLEQPF